MEQRPGPRPKGAATRPSGPPSRATGAPPRPKPAGARRPAATSTARRRPPAPKRRRQQPAWLRRFRRDLAGLAVHPTTRAGLLALALVFVGLSGNLMARTPAYYNIDETAHVGYLSSLAQGKLPGIETPIEVKVPDPSLQSRLKGAPKDQKTVWVANHPPGAYLPALPIAVVTNALGIEEALPVALRIGGIVAGLFAVGFAYLLGREVADGDERAGLLTAAITVCVPTFTFVSGTGMTDSASFAAGVAVTWMAVRMIRLGFTSSRTWWLAAFVTCAAFTRLTSAVIAVVTVLILTALAKEGRGRFAATALLPAAVLTGWWYLRIQHLYGDVAASDYLLTRMGENRGATSSTAETVTSGWLWDDISRGLVMSAPPYRFMFDYVWFRLLKVAVVGTVLTVVFAPLVRWLRRSPRPPFDIRRLDDRGTGRTGVCAAVVLAVTVILPYLFMVQHLAGGGGRHSRYLLPMVPVIAAVIARAVWMLPAAATRWTRLAIVGVGAIVSFLLVRDLKLPQFYPVVNPLWIATLLPRTVSTLAAALAIIGFAVLIWSLAVDEDTHLLGEPQAAGSGARSRRAPSPRRGGSAPASRRPSATADVNRRRRPPEPAPPPTR